MLKHLVVLIALSSTFALSQNNGRAYDSLAQKAKELYTSREYPAAATFYLALIAAPCAEKWRGGNSYNLACCYALAGETEKAFDALGQSIDYGFSDSKLMGSDADFSSLRSRDPERFTALVDRAKEAAGTQPPPETPL